MRQFGLAAAGSASRSFLPRLPFLARRLGPVASTSYRLAARIANALKAGAAAKELVDLNGSEVILLCAPEASIERLVRGLTEARLDWTAKSLLFCDSRAYTCDFPRFRELGASVASINPIEEYPGRYVIEGDPDALRQARLLVRDLKGKAIEIASDRIRMYDAARTLAGSLFTPLIETCNECIRQAGLTGPAAATLTEALLQRSLRGFMRSGRKSWSGAIAYANRTAIDREFKALVAAKPLMGGYYRSLAEFAFDLYSTFPELTRYSRR